MRKKRLYNRMGSSILAMLLILSLCVSPLTSLQASAAEKEGLTIQVRPNTPKKVWKTGDSIDMSQYFTICYNGEEVYGVYDAGDSWFETNPDPEDPEAGAPVSETMQISYSDAEGNDLTEIPSDPGKYSVSAKFASERYFVYMNSDWDVAEDDWICPDTEATVTFEYTILEDDALSFSVEVSENNLKFTNEEFFDEEGNQIVNLEDYFKVYVWKEKDKKEATAELKLSYYDAEGKLLNENPKTLGSYKVRATLEEGTTVICGDSEYTVDEEVSDTLSYQIVKVYEGLELVYGEESLDDEDAFILLMFGDGFTASEQQKFYESAVETSEYMMNTSPWDEFKDTVKIYAYGVESEESGATADTATKKSEANKEKENNPRKTYFETSFWSGGLERLLCASEEGLKKAENLKNEVCKDADYSVIIVNSTKYGGSGGDICVASLNDSSLEMMLHELGHTVADLADEYWAGVNYAEEKANMTKESDPEKVPWHRFVGKNGVGVYKYNQNETEVDWYCPSDNCKMQYLGEEYPFCEVCKEELRKAFCAGSNVTKMFFQTYADEFFELEGEPGKDMREYIIIRKGEEEITGDQLSDNELKLTYCDADGNPLTGVPSEVGTYIVKAEFTGKGTFGECSVEGTYTIKLPDWITCDGVQSKEYDGEPVEATNIQVNQEKYDDEYTTSVRYEGTLLNGDTYSSENGPFKPGKYTVTITATDNDGKAFSEKVIEFQISIKKTTLVENDEPKYTGASDQINNKRIAIVGEGFTKDEQDKFEALAQEYVDYILGIEPFKETKLYFDFVSAEAISDQSGLGENSYFKLTCDETGKIDSDSLTNSRSIISAISYYNITPWCKANIVIVNDDQVTDGAIVDDGFRAYICAGADKDGMQYAARELLNYLTGHAEGYEATTEEEIAAQREELMAALYSISWGEDCAIVVSRAYDKTFVENDSPVELDNEFQVYVGKAIEDETTGEDKTVAVEVPIDQLNYSVTYYDNEGKPLDEAPSKAGNYSALMELLPTTDKVFVTDLSYETIWELREGERVDYDDPEQTVYNADGEEIGYLMWEGVQKVTVDGADYFIPCARGKSTFKISSVQEIKIQEAQDYLAKAKEALAKGKFKEAQEYLTKAQEAMEEAAAAEEESVEDRQELERALREAQEQLAEAIKQSEENKAAAEEALKKAEAALKEAEAARKEAEAVKKEAANQVATAKFQVKKSSIKSIKSTKKKTVKLTWKKISGAEGYEIQYSKNSNFKSAKKVTTKSTSKTLTKLTSKKKYYVRVRAYKTIGGKKVYSKWTTKKSVKVK